MSEPVDELHLSQTLDGRYQLNGPFCADNGQVLATALEGEVDRALRAARDGDPSVPEVASQLRAGALVDLVAQKMRREPSEASVPDRYRVAVFVRVDTPQPPLAGCDSPTFRVVLGARSEVLDVVRLTQQWPAGIRRAITWRDRKCVFPGCDRPPSLCDVHHCQPWRHGGTTSVSNGALFVSKNHTLWSIAVEEGRPTVRRPDGGIFRIARLDIAPPCALDRAG